MVSRWRQSSTTVLSSTTGPSASLTTTSASSGSPQRLLSTSSRESISVRMISLKRANLLTEANPPASPVLIAVTFQNSGGQRTAWHLDRWVERSAPRRGKGLSGDLRGHGSRSAGDRRHSRRCRQRRRLSSPAEPASPACRAPVHRRPRRLRGHRNHAHRPRHAAADGGPRSILAAPSRVAAALQPAPGSHPAWRQQRIRA